jgi:ABC-2 type transport system permease protein
MIRLIQNEWMKLFNATSTYVMIGLLLLGLAGSTAFSMYESSKEHTPPEEAEWKAELEELNSRYQNDLESNNVFLKEMASRTVAENTYRLEKNISPYEKTTVWKFIENNKILIDLLGVFIMVIASTIITKEFKSGTIKLLLIRPYSRISILLSKYLTVILFGMFMLTTLLLVSFIMGGILFGFDGPNTILVYQENEVIERSRIVNLLLVYLSKLPNILVLSALALMISAFSKSESLASSISIVFLIVGSNITNLIAERFDWAKFSLFANTDLMVYFDGKPIVDGMNIYFSISMVMLYFFTFIGLSMVIFNKRDVSQV